MTIRMIKRRKLLFFILFILILILASSCENNVYIDNSIDGLGNIWRVGSGDTTLYFETANEAISYIEEQGASSSKDVTKTSDVNRTVTLMRPVLAQDSDGILDSSYEQYVVDDLYRGSIEIPSTFEGSLCIDFNGYRYDFSNTASAFFVIEGGDNVYIYNGTSVIFNEASHEPYAISVDTNTVTIDEHLLDDRRVNPKALDVKSSGSVVIKTSTTKDKTSIKGSFNVEGSLSIENGIIYIDSITKKTDSSFDITGGEIHNPHEYDDIVLPAIDEEKFEENNGEHEYIHTWSTTAFEEETIKEPTCIEEGKKRLYYKCTGCDATIYKDVTLDTIDHDHSGDYVTTDETSHWRVCPVCENKIDIAQHTFTKWTKNEGDGKWYRNCTVCGREEEDSHFEHTIIHHSYTSPTCTVAGNKEYWSCAVCEKCFSDKEGDTEITQSSTVIGALGHDWNEDTWTSDSNTHWHKCNRTGCTAKKDEKEHTNEYYYNALSITDKGIPYLTISHKCNVCNREVSTKYTKEDGVFHLTPLDGFTYTYERSTGVATIAINSAKSYSTVKWYDIDGKEIEFLNNSQAREFKFEPNDKYGFRCELINENNKVIESCYIELKQYKE